MGSTDQTNPIEKLSAETAASWCRKLSAATPSSNGGWTVEMDDLGDGWIEAKHPIEIHSFKADAREVVAAHNATLRAHDREIARIVREYVRKRDCGKDKGLSQTKEKE